MEIRRNPTRTVNIGNTVIGGGNPLVVQSMCTAHTRDSEATAKQATILSEAGAGVVRIAVDNKKDAEALLGEHRDGNLKSAVPSPCNIFIRNMRNAIYRSSTIDSINIPASRS